MKSIRIFWMLALGAVVLSVALPLSYSEIEGGKLIFTGKVKGPKGETLDSVRIVIKDSSNAQVIKTLYSDNKGKFKLKLEYGVVRNIHFEKAGHVQMFAFINTAVPLSKSFLDYYFDAHINMLSDSIEFNKRAISRTAFLNVKFNNALDQFAESYDRQIVFLEELAKPNLGLIMLKGYVRDSLLDTFHVKLSAYDALTKELLDTALTTQHGYYELEVPLQREIKVEIESPDHYPVYTTMKTIVPQKIVQQDFQLDKTFHLIPRQNEDVNRQAFALPLDELKYDSSKSTFVSEPVVKQKFEDVLYSFPKTIKLAGELSNQEGRDFTSTTIAVKDGNNLIHEAKIDSGNRFEVEMPYQSIVHVNFRTTGYHEGFISFNTNMNKGDMNNAASMNTQVELFNKDRTDINPKAFELPMAKYYYDKKQKGFKTDTSITGAFTKALHNIQIKRDPGSTAAGFLVLTGVVVNPATNKKVGEAKVRVLDGDKNVLSYFNADKRGKFNLRLNLNRFYFLELESPGYYNTLLRFDTKVPKGIENKDIEQEGLQALIIHEQDVLAGKPVPAELVKGREITAYYYDTAENMFVEDLSIFDNFRIAVEQYNPPVVEQIAEKVGTPDPTLLFTGVVKNKDNNPVSGVTVALMEKRKAVVSTLTDEKGRYQLELPFNQETEIKYSGADIYPTTLLVSTILPKDKEPQTDTTRAPELVAYKLDDPDVNPEAFKSPWQKVYYDSGLKNFIADAAVSRQFEAKLNTVPDNRMLWVEGKAVSAAGRPVSNARVYIISKNQVMDSVFTDNRGRYALRLPYQREYRITAKEPGYYETFAAISTKTNKADEKLIDKRLKNFDIILVRKDESRVNPASIYTPTALARYDASKDEFVVDESVDKQYLAALYLPEPEPEKPAESEIQLTSEKVEAKVAVVDQSTARENLQENVVKPFEASKNQSLKNDVMLDFHQTLRGVNKSFNLDKIDNVSLGTQTITNTGYEIEENTGGRIDENDLATIDTRNLINEIAAGIFGFRKGQIQLFSLDSTFDVKLRTRIFLLEEGFGVHQVKRNKVMSPGNAIEYVHIQDWWFIDTYYKNGKKISESEYEEDMGFYMQSAIVIDRTPRVSVQTDEDES